MGVVEELPSGDAPSSGDERRSRARIARGGPLRRLRRRGLALARRLGPKTRLGLLRRLAGPLLLAALPLFWVADATYRASLATLGRDQGIFQYIAWAVGQGDVDYRDVRDVNGPLVHLIHMVMLALGGADEHRFRALDLIATGASFAVVGALLPGIGARRPPRWTERAAWAAAAWVVLSAQYALYSYWNQAQRESFCDWFLLPSLALQIAWPARDARGASRRIAVVAALSTVTWFGKPTYALFTLAQLAVLLADPAVVLPRRRRLASFALGGALGALVPLLYLVRYGDVAAFAKITFYDVPQIYRYIWARSVPELLGAPGALDAAARGLAASAVLAALVATRALPGRLFALALAPVCALASVIVQRKGFDYHFHPLTATTHLGFMAVGIMLWERFRSAPARRPLGRLVAVGALASYGLFVASSMRESPHVRDAWILAGGETAELRAQPEYFHKFRTHDFFPWELRRAAHFLAEHTRPTARVQTHGMDPYLLFLARRRSATPYIYAYDLNASAALEGGWSNEPSAHERERIEAARAAHEADMLARLRASPPEAFVFLDRSPLISVPDAWADFQQCCREAADWVAGRYRRAAAFREIQVWLRNDLPLVRGHGGPPEAR